MALGEVQCSGHTGWTSASTEGSSAVDVAGVEGSGWGLGLGLDVTVGVLEGLLPADLDTAFLCRLPEVFAVSSTVFPSSALPDVTSRVLSAVGGAVSWFPFLPAAGKGQCLSQYTELVILSPRVFRGGAGAAAVISSTAVPVEATSSTLGTESTGNLAVSS